MVEYMSFDDVLRELKVEEDELKRMVSEGELRAFRDENRMKFRKDDVEGLKMGRITEPTIILPEEPTTFDITEGSVPEEISETSVIDISELEELRTPEDTSIPKLDFVEHGTTGVTDEIFRSETEFGLDEGVATDLEAQETFIEERPEEEGTMTEPLEVVEETATEETVTAAPATLKRTVRAAPRPTRSRRIEALAEAPPAINPVWTFALGMILFFFVMTGFLIVDFIRCGSDLTKEPIGITESISDTFYGLFKGE